MKYYCSNCGEYIKEDTEIIVDQYDDIYCENCYDVDYITTYRINGEYRGTDEDVAEFESIEDYVKTYSSNIKA